MKTMIQSLPILASVALLAGCGSMSSSEATSVANTHAMVVNDTCPIMGSPVDASVPTASFHGMNVGFCCEGCVDKWDNWSDTQKDEFLSGL